MGRKLDLIGQKFGRLVVLEFSHMDKHGKSQWLCKCDCGNKKIVGGASMKRKNTLSCGCLASEWTIKKNTKHGHAKRGKQHYLYKTWLKIRDRCNVPSSPAYKNYGGRGIKVCKRWDNFQNFLDDMGDRPEGYTIERIDNDGDYCPKNCKWATRREQANNKRFPNMKGEANNSAKLTEKDVLYIREEYKKGKRQRDLVIEMGISKAQISSIITRRTWKHLPDSPEKPKILQEEAKRRRQNNEFIDPLSEETS